MSVCSSRTSKKFTWMSSIRSTTYPAKSLFAKASDDVSTAPTSAIQPRPLKNATMSWWDRSMPSRRPATRDARRGLPLDSRYPTIRRASRAAIPGKTSRSRIASPTTMKPPRLSRNRS